MSRAREERWYALVLASSLTLSLRTSSWGTCRTRHSLTPARPTITSVQRRFCRRCRRETSPPSPGVACPGGSITGSYGVPRRFIGSNFPYGAFYILQQESTGRSNYNALQASLRVNGWHGVTSIVNYAWSKSLDDSSDGEDFEPNAAQPNDSTRPNLEYGPSNFNVPHRFTWIFGYELPNMGGSMRRLKNGWGFNSTVTLQSGQPFQFNYNFEDDFSGSGLGFDRPDVVGPIRYHPRDPSNFIDLSAFAIPCTVDPLLGANGAASDCVPGTRHFG